MALLQLDHVNLRTANLAGLTAFYCDVLGLRLGERPPFAFAGAWLYCADRAVVHLVEVAAPPQPTGALRLEHFAFVADDFDELVARLSRAGLEYRLSGSLGEVGRRALLALGG